MHRSLLKNLSASVAFGLCLATAPASAAGLLGERYVSLGYDQIFVESGAYDDGSGLSLFYNHPLSENIDLGGSYTYAAYGDADGRDEVGDFSDQRLQFMMTAFGLPELDRLWARVGAGIGKVEHGDDDMTSLSWVGMAGTEYMLGEKAVLHPYVGWSDVLNDKESVKFVYGLQAVLNAGEKFGVNFRIEGDQHYNFVLSVGALMRF